MDAGKAGVLVLDYGDARLDLEAVRRASLALGLHDFEGCTIRYDDLGQFLGLQRLAQSGRPWVASHRSSAFKSGAALFEGGR